MNNIDHAHSLGIPEGYFDDLKTDILREVEISEGEQFLDHFCKKKHGLKASDVYLASLKQDLVSSAKEAPIKNTSWQRWFQSIAACGILAIIGLAIFNGSQPSELAEEKSFEELLTEVSATDDYLALLTYDELEELEFTAQSLEDEVSYQTLDYILEDEDLLNTLTEDFLDY
ncbi:MAG: hypothetical protein AB8B53_00390 [Flavobacteriales bacterium]